jgi:hypothetical protein
LAASKGMHCAIALFVVVSGEYPVRLVW